MPLTDCLWAQPVARNLIHEFSGLESPAEVTMLKESVAELTRQLSASEEENDVRTRDHPHQSSALQSFICRGFH